MKGALELADSWRRADLIKATRRGFQKALGLKLIAVARTRLTAVLGVKPAHANSVGSVHGGVLMALGDSLGGLGALQNLQPGYATATLESKTNFFRPAKGRLLRAQCRALHIGRRTSVWQTTVRDERARLVAVVTQTQLHFEVNPAPSGRARRPARRQG
jgi:1,4-dihydroxy-2-naphthoyl-CoA hydrolase